jgi:hypothetical protein
MKVDALYCSLLTAHSLLMNLSYFTGLKQKLMRLISFFLCLLVITSCSQKDSKKSTEQSNVASNQDTSQQQTGDHSKNSNELVSAIQADVQKINSLQLTEKKFTFNLDGCTDGELRYYLHNDKIVKVVEEGFIGDGEWETEYYYKDGKLIFTKDKSTGGPAVGPVTTSVSTTYVQDDKIALTMLNDSMVTSERSALTPTAKEYKILAAYNTKDWDKALCE